MKILPMYLVYSNYYYLIYTYYYFWQIFAGRPNLFMLFEIIECPPNDMYLKSLFSQLLFICFVTLEWCMGLCCSQNHTSSPAIQSKEDSASFTRIAEPLSSHISFVREAFFFYSWNLISVCFLHCLFKVIEYCNFFLLISIIPTCMLNEQWKGLMRHDVYSDAFGENVHLMKKWTET